MKPRHVYVVLAVVGTVLPLWQFAPFLLDHGLDSRLFLGQLFATPVSAFFGMDVIVSSLALWALIYIEGRRAAVPRRWLPVVASLTVGVSLGLPLFLYMRESHLEHQSNTPE